jgi:EmrB/QacA subfamily drug resistance transporter
MLLSSLGSSIANVGLPTFARAFGASFQAVQWVVLAYLVAITSLILSAGRLGDLVGRRRLLLAGLLLFTAASLLCALAPTLRLLVAARAAQGAGAAVMMALTLAMVGETVPKARTGRAMGLIAAMSAAGTALGPSLGGLLIAWSGWRAIFLVNLPVGLVAFLLALRHLPLDSPRREGLRESFDAPGTILLALALTAYALAMTIAPGRFGPLNMVLLLAAALAAGLFMVAETRATSPLIRMAMFRDRELSGGLATSALVATVMMAALVVGPFYLSLGLGLEAIAVGLALSVGPLVAALTGVPAGHLADRFGARRTVLAGLLAMAAGCMGLSLAPATAGIFGYLVPMAVVTAGYALFQTANASAVMANVPADRRGVVSGLLSLARNLGLVTGASAMGALFAAASGAADLAAAGPAAVASGMRATFAAAAVLIAAAVAVAVAAREGASRGIGRSN